MSALNIRRQQTRHKLSAKADDLAPYKPVCVCSKTRAQYAPRRAITAKKVFHKISRSKVRVQFST